MKKADIELNMSIELILIIVGLIIVLILIAGIILNLESIGDSLALSIGEIF